MPDIFSSLLTVGGFSKEEDREAPKNDGRDVIDDDELVACNVPVDAAAAAAAKYNTNNLH